jgi:hypothetical protein
MSVALFTAFQERIVMVQPNLVGFSAISYHAGFVDDILSAIPKKVLSGENKIFIVK